MKEGVAAVAEAGDRRPCDLVMKGGITSGIVYPSAVLALRTRGYDFRSIGGTSAGAIAAAATAAAQYGGDAGFARLEELRDELTADGLMRQLFQPSRAARPAFELMLKLQETEGTARKLAVGVWALLRRLWLHSVTWMAAALFLLAFVVSRFGGGDERSWTGWVALSLVLAIVGLAGLGAGAGVRAWRLFTTHLPDNFFGICNGMRTDAHAPGALTEWLYERIQACAGMDAGDGGEPLTFRHLVERDVELSMMTTNLTYAVPLRLPLSDDEAPHKYLFSLEDFARLFPGPVVEHLSKVPVDTPATDDHPELRALPTGDLPVIVATRMSLSFPVLLSAVPLWTMEQGVAVRHWLSDGGITSNFPIHFFDAWLPTRPTFGLNLVPAQRAADPVAERDEELLAEDPYGFRPVRRRAGIDGTAGFLKQILDTMQNWRDLLQTELPGFSDRIEAIELEATEGGMNLTMPAPVITALIRKGKSAAGRLASRFDWDKHRLERYRLLMHLLDREINRGGGSNPGMAAVYLAEMRELLTGAQDENPALALWGPRADELTTSMLDEAADWAEHFVRRPPPSPDPALRTTPKE